VLEKSQATWMVDGLMVKGMHLVEVNSPEIWTKSGGLIA